MQKPLEITWRGVAKTDWKEEVIRSEMAKLERFHGRIMSANVAVERPQVHQRSGSPWRVRVELRIPPGHTVVATREAGEGDIHEGLDQTVRAAFQAARRQVESIAAKQRGEVKAHPEQDFNAVVLRVFRQAGYGFARTLEDDREVYFHRNAVLGGEFDRVEPGTGVRIVVEMGEKGPQASSLKIVDKPGVRAARTEDPGMELPPGWSE